MHDHVYDQEVAEPDHLKTPADCTNPAVYYKSCSCGATGTTDIFTSGASLGHDYTKETETAAYLKDAAANCTEHNTYWYACTRCDASAGDDGAATGAYYSSATTGPHSFTEQVQDPAHYVGGTGTDCRSAKKYYYDCAHCAEMGTDTWDSDEYGPHDFAGSSWSSDETGHWHACQNAGCTEKDRYGTHIPNIPAPTETQDQTCTVCGRVLDTATGHVCSSHLTLVSGFSATCTTPGKITHYRCTCSNLYEDRDALRLTTEAAVTLFPLGHNYTQQITDDTHKRSTAADCRDYDTYWYDCSRCDASAGDDTGATDKFYNGAQGPHVYGVEWIARGAEGHAHKCQYHDVYDTPESHTPDHDGGATTEYPILCTKCGYEIEARLEEGTIRVELPFTLHVQKTGSKNPGSQTFSFVAEEFGAPVEYELITSTLETNGAKTYDGTFVFTISEGDADNLSEGFVFRQVKGSAKGWTYDETKFWVVPAFADGNSIEYWEYYLLDGDGQPSDENRPNGAIFTNSYYARSSGGHSDRDNDDDSPKADTQNVINPETGGRSNLGLWVALLVVSSSAAAITWSSKKEH